jgi:hypothetical protein
MTELETRPSPEAISAANDRAYEALQETAALTESYARSLGEAAWRAEAVTTKVHLLQLRACVLTAIGMFDDLERGEKIGGGA